ncbi:MAG: class I SAM-dependent methyltransferase [Acidobacteria bacterium]|nr:class I SAM-dependent methyltransferase [Acidobacteriota bacterium]MBI3427781.1 class I SAM-dependent methyltransferase [Acidobacteriota bacterium]
MKLREEFGDIDIYLFDQLLKGNIQPGLALLDAGCGGGRNLVYFLRHHYKVFAVDTNPQAIQQVQALAAHLAPHLPAHNFQLADVAALPCVNARFDLVISSAVLHFARNPQHFDQMLAEMWRVLKPGGMLFARLASSIGIEEHVRPVGNGWFALPDGTERFLVDEAMLSAAMERLGAALLEPLKTTNVANLRCMTTWLLGKPA